MAGHLKQMYLTTQINTIHKVVFVGTMHIPVTHRRGRETGVCRPAFYVVCWAI
jgi:hypothetical protein